MGSVNDNKRNYFLKLREDYLFSDDIFDALLSMPNGRDYMIIYLMLCMLAKNSNGFLGQQLDNGLTIVYDVAKIERYCRYFDGDTIRCALEAFRGLGLVEDEPDGLLFVTRAPEMVGSETGAAQRMRDSRAKRLSDERSVAPKGKPKKAIADRGPTTYTDDFLAVWDAYPYRIPKPDELSADGKPRRPTKGEKTRAFQQFTKCLDAGWTVEQLMQATRNYAASQDPYYVQNASTFFGPGKPFETYVNGDTQMDSGMVEHQTEDYSRFEEDIC